MNPSRHPRTPDANPSATTTQTVETLNVPLKDLPEQARADVQAGKYRSVRHALRAYGGQPILLDDFGAGPRLRWPKREASLAKQSVPEYLMAMSALHANGFLTMIDGVYFHTASSTPPSETRATNAFGVTSSALTRGDRT